MTPAELAVIRERAEKAQAWKFGDRPLTQAYRTDIPALLDEVERLRGALGEFADIPCVYDANPPRCSDTDREQGTWCGPCFARDALAGGQP